MAKKILTTPIKDEDLADIKAGDIIYLNGHIVTCRDVAHRRLIEGQCCRWRDIACRADCATD